MGPSRLKQLLDKFNAGFINSHFVLTSGRHSDGYINLRVLAGNADALFDISASMAEEICQHEYDIDIEGCLTVEDQKKQVILVGPETLGRTLAEFITVSGASIGDYFAWCDMKKDAAGNDIAAWNPKLSFPEMINGARCYIVDDLLTTAKSVKLVKQLIEETGGKVEGVVVVVRRDQEITAETIGVPWLCSLLDVEGFNTYEADSCPLCEALVPMRLRPGHGHEWIKTHEGYPTC